MPFIFNKTKIEEVILIEPKVLKDSRGFFMESYKKSDFIKNGIKDDFSQDNHSKSSKGVLRGLHYQKKTKTQAKLIRCTKGCIFDVAVDIKVNSKTFGKWVGFELSEENKKILYIPKGFAHGFVVLSDEAEIIYKVSSEFCPELDRGIRWNDPTINIDWGINFEPLISEKDALQPFFKDLKDEDLL
jgi:dTDP-4-dehydrorhamnose 3,5-epimerase